MKKKLKKLLSKKIFYVTFALILVGTIEIVYASNLINSKNVSYSNSSSKLSSTNVQGAIDELYNSCKGIKEECPSDRDCFSHSAKTTLIKLNADIVMSGDGLYKDSYDQNRFVYRGKDPNNYIKFNDETWRIIAIESDGTLKISRSEIEYLKWDDNSNSWINSSIKNYLNNDYYNTIKDKELIDKHDFYVGRIEKNQSLGFKNEINQEKQTKWNGYIGLLNASDYIKSSLNSSCDSIYNSFYGVSSEYYPCKNNNYIYFGTDGFWIINDNSTLEAWYVGTAGVGLTKKSDSRNILPVVYLKNNLSFSKTGTSSEPYQINKLTNN